jgi:hypothetical protein
MTKDEFKARWRYRLAGIALYGSVSEIKDGPLARASKLMEIPAQVEQLLEAMYADLAPKAPTGPQEKSK